ncbi:MAG TPA: SDR family oxidoreductase [Chthoniobacter sp.]|jgi:3-oxoacyl-[acyl-carrier protein] reductase
MNHSVAIVTGSSHGIGRATALRLAKEFSAVVVVARDESALTEVSKEIAAAGAKPLVLRRDLSRVESAREVIDATLNAFGRIDALVNIAGSVPRIDLLETTDEQWDAGFALKFHGGRRLALNAWDALKDSNGAVVFLSGAAADHPQTMGAAVSSVNAAIEALSKAFADRGLIDGVQVNTVSPGAIMTRRRMGMIEKIAAAKGISIESAKSSYLEHARINRFGEPEEIAELIAFCVSPKMRWMTGSVLRMDGGETNSL